MLQRVKVSSKNQIAIPSSARRQLGIAPDDHLIVVVEDGALMLVPEPTEPVMELRGVGREIRQGDDAQDDVNGLRDE